MKTISSLASKLTLIVAALVLSSNAINAQAALNDNGSCYIGGSVIVDVRANDTYPANYNTILYPFVPLPAHGTITILNGDSIQYTPAPNYVGTDEFLYGIENPSNPGYAIDTARVFINVTSNPNCTATIYLSSPTSSATCGDTLFFGASTTNTPVPANTWFWDFGNGDTASGTGSFVPMENVYSYGTYTVTLISGNTSTGCYTAATLVVNSGSGITVDAGPDAFGCQQPAQLNATVVPSATNCVYSWSPATHLNFSNIANPQATYVDDELYTVTVTNTVTGCVSQDTVRATAYNWTTDTFPMCDSTILDFGPGATFYNWQFYTDPQGNTSMINVFTQTLTVTQPGTYAGYANFPGCGALTSLFHVVDTCNIFVCAVDAGPDTTFCQQQGQLIATPASPGNYTFSWSPTNGLDNPYSQNPNVITGMQNQQYIVTMTDLSQGCTAYDTVIVSAYYWHNDTVYLCNGRSTYIDLGPGATQYTVQYTDTAGNFQSAILSSQYFTVDQPVQYLFIASFPGCGALTSMITAIDSCNFSAGAVWPGDCNYDLRVDVADVLHIGLAHGASGPVRPNASNNWYAQPMTDWAPDYLNCNYKHGDADGNGNINVNDTLPIALNYSLVHPFRLAPPQIPASAPTLKLVCTVDTVGLQTLVQVDVVLGTVPDPVDSIYGISFRITSEAALIDTNLTVINANNSWIGTTGGTMFTFQKHFQSAGIVDFAEVKSNHVNTYNGQGVIATFFIVTTDNLSGIDVCNFDLSDVTAVTEGQTYIAMNTENDSVVIDPSVPAGVIETEQPVSFSVYPNPANENVAVQTSGSVEMIEICDMRGRVVMSAVPSSNTTAINTASLAEGIYMVRVKNGATIITEKLTITR